MKIKHKVRIIIALISAIAIILSAIITEYFQSKNSVPTSHNQIIILDEDIQNSQNGSFNMNSSIKEQ
ncbi:MAG: hypothetical protein HFE57_08630 [Firmicutes bacterium]|nr:hypothetical protein [Bacillota bacterium]